MDPPRSASSRSAKHATPGLKISGRPSAAMSNHPSQMSKLAAAGTIRPNPNPTRTKNSLKQPLAPNDVVGQLSFAPATQTTVVTTTTTTTTNFPPLVIKEPRNVRDLDPVQYPLANLRTPDSLKSLHFTVGDRTAVFREADDAVGTMDEVMGAPAESVEQISWSTSFGSQNRFYIPNATIQLDRSREVNRKSTAEFSACEKQSPKKTPFTRLNFGGCEDQLHASLLEEGTEAYRGETFEILANGTGSQTLSPRSEVLSAPSFQEPKTSDYNSQTYIGLPDTETTEDSDLPGAVTPIRTEDDVVEQPPLSEQGPRSIRPRPSVLNTTAAQDMSLPSPSLSPVTAALNLRNRTSYFEDDIREQHSEPPGMNNTFHPSQESLSDTTVTERPKAAESQAPTLLAGEEKAPQDTDKQAPTASLMSIPDMIDTFDAMPSAMQEFVMYQLLKRCSKPILKFVANVVNPALKCNFLALLPIELSLNIVGNLDVKSLCRAAQVSRKWRQIIDSDEKAWKRLFDADGFKFPEGELQRAVREGWGWQNASRADDWEKDLGVVGSTPSDTENSICSYTGLPASLTLRDRTGSELALPPLKRSKRKAPTKTKSKSRKLQKREGTRSVTPTSSFDAEALLVAASGKEGPYAAANAAAMAVPYARVGLPSLRNLHLFKSIYQRHYIIRKSWMQDSTKPKHIAFRAHQRHVVTCLQFDTDKILTGSDDTNINVYDTQTGALRKKLTGHEGGVWALQYEGDVLVSGSTDRSVRVWDIPAGKCTQVFQGHTSTVRCLQILMPSEIGRTSDGRPFMMPRQPLIITGSRDSNLRVWKLPRPGDPEYFQAGPPLDDTDCPYFVRVLTGHHHSVRAIAAHADTLVSGSYDCTVRVWRISTGEMVHRLAGHSQKVYSVVLDHKRNRCISGSMDNMVKVWSLDSGSVLYNLEGHTSLVGLLDLQQDRLVSAAADSTLRIWDPETGLCKATLRAHTGAITCFQHDGQKVISGSDRTLKMWNVANGRFVKDLLTDLSGVWQVNFNERRCVAAVQRNGLTYIEVLDFGAARDGVPESQRGHRIVVDVYGNEMVDNHDIAIDVDAMAED
ncbi:MAG: hypothetical protein LQ348_000186 [Seirophora lacunosa]|nr:MAG: hypothetical protein LQ348_000186 [Seirophora lacunosa]